MIRYLKFMLKRRTASAGFFSQSGTIKTMLYTGVRVGELVKIKADDVELNKCQIRINDGKGKKDRIVPFPTGFREVLALYIKSIKNKKKVEYLFESNWS
ncbi:tyrosine-type recombinase/integrase [Candidatus Tisiphia endosymbiont of Parasteatoda lunata]|uniref:tyrosine-type recombinase/integrase n=1 Tax=Candidatus Tisiphia endosymbiont of Parasteatoda lunata TaxID=3066275 RepID=UPI00313D8705